MKTVFFIGQNPRMSDHFHRLNVPRPGKATSPRMLPPLAPGHGDRQPLVTFDDGPRLDRPVRGA